MIFRIEPNGWSQRVPQPFPPGLRVWGGGCTIGGGLNEENESMSTRTRIGQSLTIGRSNFDNSWKRFKDYCQLSKINPPIVKDSPILVLVLMTRSPRSLPLYHWPPLAIGICWMSIVPPDFLLPCLVNGFYRTLVNGGTCFDASTRFWQLPRTSKRNSVKILARGNSKNGFFLLPRACLEAPWN